MGQDLVDHHLKEQWGYQREQLNKERRKNDVAKCISVSPDRRKKPLEAKVLGGSPWSGEPSLDQNEGSIRLLEHGCRRKIASREIDRIYEAIGAVGIGAPEQGKAALSQPCDRRSSDRQKPRLALHRHDA